MYMQLLYVYFDMSAMVENFSFGFVNENRNDKIDIVGFKTI